MIKSKKIPTQQTKLTQKYKTILNLIVGKIKAAQTRAMVAVNHELIEVYRGIGKTIHEQQKTAEWGSSVVELLATADTVCRN